MNSIDTKNTILVRIATVLDLLDRENARCQRIDQKLAISYAMGVIEGLRAEIRSM